jgi:hypothetical protein
MTIHAIDLSPRRTARLAGGSILAIAILALFANFFVLKDLIVSGDAATTAGNILASEGLFRAGIASLLVVVVLDMVAAWALYIFFKPVNQSFALLTAWFRVVYAAFFAVAVLNLILALELVGGESYLTSLAPEQAQSQMLFFLNAFTYGWLIGLVFFGMHLAGLGYLVLTSGSIPKVVGVMLIAAALGYLLDSFAHVLLANYDDYETVFLIIVAVSGIIGELSLTAWLLVKGGKDQPGDHRSLEASPVVTYPATV